MASSGVQQLASQVGGLVIAQGVLAVLAGIAMLFWPGATAVILVVLFGVFVLSWGIVELVRSLMGAGQNGTWWLGLIFSVLVIILGVYLLRNVELSLALFVLLVGFTFVVRGIVDLLVAFFSRDRDVRDNRALLVVAGALGLLAGVFVLIQPAASGLAFIWIVGLYTILYGSVLVATALKARA